MNDAIDFSTEYQQHNARQSKSRKVSTESMKLSAISTALIKMKILLVLAERHLGFPPFANQNRWFSTLRSEAQMLS